MYSNRNSESAEGVEALAASYLAMASDLPVVSLGRAAGTRCEILAVLGGAQPGASFKDLLGPGMVVLARKGGLIRPGQPIIESSSGSMGLGLAWAGRLLRHPVTVVSDPALPAVTRTKIRALGASLVEVPSADPQLGWQGAREARVRELVAARPEFYFVDQNNNPLNPAVHERWLVPMLARKVDPSGITAGVFVVGSGGHFSAISRWLKEGNRMCHTYAGDRPGSVTFGPGRPGSSRVRGVGNSNGVPRVIAANLDLVDDVVVVDDDWAFEACRDLALRRGIFVGGSSGAAYAAACKVATRIGQGTILTLFPDRGELYPEIFATLASPALPGMPQ